MRMRVFRAGNQQKLIEPLQRLLTGVTQELDKEAAKQKRDEEAAKRVEEHVKKHQAEKARKLAEQKRAEALKELQYMRHACEELLKLRDDASDKNADKLTALNTACGKFQSNLQVIMDSQVLESADKDAVSKLKGLLQTVLGKSSSTTE